MRVVVYADILFVLNAYITYALLLVTELLCRTRAGRLRRALSALLGGLCAFVIFLPRLPKAVFLLFRVLSAAVLVPVAFGKGSRKRFLLLFGAFFSVSFVFAGLMFALWYAVRPQSMLCFGSVVYFNISALTLVVLTAVCYGVFYVVQLLLRARPPQRSLFRLTVTLGGKSVCCSALLDSGNQLTEPFSGLPVIVGERRTMQQLIGAADLASPETAAKLRLRQIPCRTLTGESVLPGFRPDEVILRSADREIRTADVYIALSDKPICGGDFGALLHPNLTEEKNVILCQK